MNLYEATRRLDEIGPDIGRFCVSSVHHGGSPTPEGAAVEALARVMMSEFPEWDVRVICQAPESGEDRWRELLSELRGNSTDQQATWSSGERFRRALRAVAMPEAPARVSPTKSYLVVGEDSDQSRLLREWLAAQGAGHVAFLNAGENGAWSIPPAIAKCTDRHPLGGVFLLPWGSSEGLIARLPAERFQSRIRECVAFIASVATETEDMDIDHFVIFSSSAAVLGVEGQASYAAMTGWLDAFGAERCRNGRAGLAINWGPWQGAGQWAKSDRGREAIRRQGWRNIEPAVGFQTMARAMASDLIQVHVLPVDWSMLGASGYSGLFSTKPSPATVAASPATPMEEVSRLIGEDLSGYSGKTTLIELGLDSMMAVRLRTF